MTRQARDRISDIRAAIARCLRYAEQLDQADPDSAEMAADAVERNIVVIGEAATRLSASVTDAIPGVDWSAIRGMRNMLVHEYFGVDRAVVREVVEVELRPLDDALREYESQARSSGAR